jgi:hypothetical protein
VTRGAYPQRILDDVCGARDSGPEQDHHARHAYGRATSFLHPATNLHQLDTSVPDLDITLIHSITLSATESNAVEILRLNTLAVIFGEGVKHPDEPHQKSRR